MLTEKIATRTLTLTNTKGASSEKAWVVPEAFANHLDKPTSVFSFFNDDSTIIDIRTNLLCSHDIKQLNRTLGKLDEKLNGKVKPLKNVADYMETEIYQHIKKIEAEVTVINNIRAAYHNILSGKGKSFDDEFYKLLPSYQEQLQNYVIHFKLSFVKAMVDNGAARFTDSLLREIRKDLKGLTNNTDLQDRFLGLMFYVQLQQRVTIKHMGNTLETAKLENKLKVQDVKHEAERDMQNWYGTYRNSLFSQRQKLIEKNQTISDLKDRNEQIRLRFADFVEGKNSDSEKPAHMTINGRYTLPHPLAMYLGDNKQPGRFGRVRA